MEEEWCASTAAGGLKVLTLFVLPRRIGLAGVRRGSAEDIGGVTAGGGAVSNRLLEIGAETAEDSNGGVGEGACAAVPLRVVESKVVPL